MSGKGLGKPAKKQVRKPVSESFAPKRLAINFQPPTLIMQYLATDSGKLYHHKMRLDSILRKPGVGRIDVLNYVKNKHYLYFMTGKVKDPQLLKFIDKILSRLPTAPHPLPRITEESHPLQSSPHSNFNQDEDFDYLNDDEYEEDYEDYEQPVDKPHSKPQAKKQAPVETGTKFNKNTFMTYCQQYEQSNEQQGGAEWDLDMEGSADFV